MLGDVDRNIYLKFFIFLFFFLLFIFNFNVVYSFYNECEKPDVPDCADYLDGYSDRWDFERCKDELDSFFVELEEYSECIKRQIDEMQSEYEDAVEKYNCKLNREGFCY